MVLESASGPDGAARWELLRDAPTELLDAVAGLLARPAWHARAACRGRGELFFPEGRGDVVPAAYRQARELCAGCPVRAECTDAGAGEAHGLWAGTTPQTRRATRRARAS